jgi:hypothetical protein
MRRDGALVAVDDITPDIQVELTALGFEVDPVPLPDFDGTGRRRRFQSFDVDEAQLQSAALQAWLKRRELNVIVLGKMEYTIKDLAKAPWLWMRGGGTLGYPQPESAKEGYPDYLGMTYDNRVPGYCAHCGIGAVQQAPFRIKAEPKTRSGIFSLEWVHDEFFVRPELFDEVFRPFGVESLPVLHHRTGLPAETLIQLKIDKVSASPRNLSGIVGYGVETCPICSRRKYVHQFPWAPPSFLTSPGPWALFKSQEYFGSGGSAWRAIIVSNELYQAIAKYKLRSIRFEPLDDHEPRP